ncbi:hypothetical protein CCYA_CCYA12G3426 [Cyanidiococcus yangmingshanensis]|nr:hypothetical protein CCYA_CCYA12G3426 [Cyanidiococcus yangmingshanensis]
MLEFVDRDSGRGLNLLVDSLAGGLAGALADLLMHPVDTVKARLQVQQSIRQKRTGSSSRPTLEEEGLRTRPYRGMLECASRIVREQGVRRGLYAGLASVLLGSVPSHAITFASYKFLKSWTPGGGYGADGVPSWWSDIASASVADLLALSTYVPAEVVAKRLQVAGMGPARDYSSPFQALRVIAKTEGIRKGLYAGATATMFRDVPFTALQFAIFEQMKSLLGPIAQTSGGMLLCGLTAGAGAGAATTPLDVVKTRLQTQQIGADRPYRGVLHCLRAIVLEEGPTALFKGVFPRIVWVAPASAITLAVYEQIIRWIQPSRQTLSTAAE